MYVCVIVLLGDPSLSGDHCVAFSTPRTPRGVARGAGATRGERGMDEGECEGDHEGERWEEMDAWWWGGVGVECAGGGVGGWES